jgi:uncharacterized protein YjiS (DUF1127 family)
MIILIGMKAAIAGPVAHVKSLLSDYAARVAAMKQRRETYHSLSALDDRALRDIGLSRTMVLSASIHGTRSGMSGSTES